MVTVWILFAAVVVMGAGALVWAALLLHAVVSTWRKDQHAE